MAPRTDLIGIAGAGKAARALGRLLVQAGEPVACVASRDPGHAQAAAAFMGAGVQPVSYAQFPPRVSRVLIAVADGAITEVAALLAARLEPSIALHTCGARGAGALAPLCARGAATGVIHPLQTLTGGVESVDALRGAAFAVWGDPAAVAWAERIAAIAHGEVLRIAPEHRALYHAAAVMGSNYIVALVDAAQSLLACAGVEPGTALRALAPLMRAAVDRAVAAGAVAALTGPIERGDAETVAAHMAALAAAPAPVRALYRAAGAQTIDIARRRGLPPAAAQQLEAILFPPGRNRNAT